MYSELCTSLDKTISVKVVILHPPLSQLQRIYVEVVFIRKIIQLLKLRQKHFVRYRSSKEITWLNLQLIKWLSFRCSPTSWRCSLSTRASRNGCRRLTCTAARSLRRTSRTKTGWSASLRYLRMLPRFENVNLDYLYVKSTSLSCAGVYLDRKTLHNIFI